jgi:hypothetical protein
VERQTAPTSSSQASARQCTEGGRPTEASDGQGNLTGCELWRHAACRPQPGLGLEGVRLQPRPDAAEALMLPSLQQWRAARSPGPPSSELRHTTRWAAAAARTGSKDRAGRAGRCRNPSPWPQGSGWSEPMGWIRIPLLPATRRTPWSAAGCNKPAPRVRSKPSKS